MTEPLIFEAVEPSKKMNRLILVGNGFDLAHSMKTSYNHFILDYVVSCFNEASSGRIYSDDALQIDTGHEGYYWPQGSFESMEDVITSLYDEGSLYPLFSKQPFRKRNIELTNLFNVKFKAPFFEHLIKNCSSTNWVDIENEYYQKLKGSLTQPSRKGKVHDIEQLNLNMKWLIDKLQKYLSKLDINHKYLAEYEEIIHAPIDKEDFADKEYYSGSKIDVDHTMVVNFNYTSTVKQYVSNGNKVKDKVSINYIHGQLNNNSNPIIFGFGDELDNDYSTIELDKSKGLFEHIKSFWYFKTSNYYNLIRFIDSNDFQVYVFGHSCGLSDRTMLNMIFEHERCKSIKIFYHGNEEENNYTPLTQEISRHFKDKRLMRRRIVSLDRSSSMPQVK